MSELLFILFCVCSATLIWKLRQQSEYAKELITAHCCRLDLQLLSVSRSHFNYRSGENFLQACFIFEFSSDNDNCYQGRLYLNGRRRPRFKLPAYRSFEESGTLH